MAQGTPEPSEYQQLSESIGGEPIVPGVDGYDDARSVWNAMINKCPRGRGRGQSHRRCRTPALPLPATTAYPSLSAVADKMLPDTVPSMTAWSWISRPGGTSWSTPIGKPSSWGQVPPYWINIYGFWSDSADDGHRIGFVRRLASAMEPFSSGTQYLNFMAAGPDNPTLPGAPAIEPLVYGAEKLGKLRSLKL